MLHYKDLHWKRIELHGWDNKAKAQVVLKQCHEDYKKKFGK
jgi:inorganic pyrophosphatase